MIRCRGMESGIHWVLGCHDDGRPLSPEWTDHEIRTDSTGRFRDVDETEFNAVCTEWERAVKTAVAGAEVIYWDDGQAHVRGTLTIVGQDGRRTERRFSVGNVPVDRSAREYAAEALHAGTAVFGTDSASEGDCE